MRIVTSIFVVSCLSVVSAQAGRTENQQQEQPRTPTTLSDAHAELERILSPQELAKIDAMPSENDMIQYHFSLGLSIRNGWGLWQGGPLAKHMEGLGFTHPDDMSGVILGTFWCKRHGKDFRLEERAAASRRSMEIARKRQEEEQNRVQRAKAMIQDMMMGLRFERRDVAVVRIPVQKGMSVRFMCPFRDGVFLTAYREWPSRQGTVLSDGYYADPATGEPRQRPDMDDYVERGLFLGADREDRRGKLGGDFHTLGFYLDLTDRRIRQIRVEEVNEVYAAVVAGDRVWFAGLTNEKPVLAGVGERNRIVVSLPRKDEIPDLGIDGRSLLAVYSKTIYRLRDREWTLIHSGDILLPRSGLPPQRHGNMVFLRDEGTGGDRKRLWWLTMGEQLHLSVLDRDVGLVGPEGPRWENSSSYCVTGSGDLWTCVGDQYAASLLRRSKDGSYSVAIMNNSVQFTGELLGFVQSHEGLCFSGIAALPDDTLLLVGNTGLYRLKGNELVQEFAFTYDEAGTTRSHRNWDPSSILVLDGDSYVIGTAMRNGVYLLHKGNDGRWSCLYLDQSRDIIVW